MKQFYKNPYKVSFDAMPTIETAQFNIDAITLICEGDGNIGGLKEIWDTYRLKSEKDGYKIQNFSSHGFNGSSIGSVRHSYSQKLHKAMFQITGRETPAAMTELIELDGYATRLDIQATFKHSQPVPDLAKLIHEARLSRGNTRGIHISDFRYISGRDGDTLYIGNRQSSMLLRVYDKSFEYGLDRGIVWRWEMQYNKEKARRIWWELDQLPRESAVFKDYFCKRLFEDCYAKGVRLPVEYGPLDLSDSLVLSKKATDRERYLKWMRETVSPVVKWMVARGEQEMVLEAMGITSIKAHIEDGENIFAIFEELAQMPIEKVIANA